MLRPRGLGVIVAILLWSGAGGASDVPPLVTQKLAPGLCISNHPQEKTYLTEDVNVLRVRRTYACQYYCMTRSYEIDRITGIHSDSVWFGNEDGREFLCEGMRLKWVETPTGKQLGYFNIVGAEPFDPRRSKSKELRRWRP